MSYVYEVNEASFAAEVLQSQLPVLVDFRAPWCWPCRMLWPVLEQLSNEFKWKVKFVKINVDSNPWVAIQYNIQWIPAIFVFKNGQIQWSPFVWVQPIDVYRSFLKKFETQTEQPSSSSEQNDEPAHLDVSGKEQLLQQLNTNKLVLVDFWAPWCGPCRMLWPVLERIVEDFNGKVKVIKINVDDEQNQVLAWEFGVSSIPQVTLIKNGQNVDQFIGALPYEAIKEVVTKNL